MAPIMQVGGLPSPTIGVHGLSDLVSDVDLRIGFRSPVLEYQRWQSKVDLEYLTRVHYPTVIRPDDNIGPPTRAFARVPSRRISRLARVSPDSCRSARFSQERQSTGVKSACRSS